MYAIKNIKTDKWVFGTDYRYFPPRQRTSKNQMLTYDTFAYALYDFSHRKCGKDYRIVVLKKIEVKRVIEPIDGEYKLKEQNK